MDKQLNITPFVIFCFDIVQNIRYFFNGVTFTEKNKINHDVMKFINIKIIDRRIDIDAPEVKLEYKDVYTIYEWALFIAICSVNSKTFFDNIFNQKEHSITPSEFLKYSGFLGLYVLKSEERLSKFSLIYLSLEKNFDLEKFVKLDLNYASHCSESEYYDLLINLNVGDAILLLEQINASEEIKKKLKKAFLDKNEYEFYKLLIQNDVDFNKSSTISKGWYFSHKLKKLNYDCEEYFYAAIRDKHFDPNMISKDFIDIVLSNKQYGDPDLDYFGLFKLYYERLACISAFIGEYKYLFMDLKTINEFYEIIQIEPELKFLKDITANDCINNTCYEPWDKFHDIYASNHGYGLPQLVNKNKSSKEFIASNGNYDRLSCENMYYLLCERNLLEDDEQNFYSFMYRMNKECNFDVEPQKIRWKGTLSELCQFLFWFTDNGDTRLWKKMADFYKMNDNSKIDTNGALNRTQNKTPRIDAFIKEIEKNIKK